MLKRIAVASGGVLLIAYIGLAEAAQAAEAITTQEGCFAAVDSLSESFQNQTYAKTTKAKPGEAGKALAALEEQCKANQLAEASRTAAEIKAMLPKQ
jgi:hypothetical protein